MPNEYPISVSVDEVHQMMQTRDSFVLLDCRRIEEYQLVKLPGALFFPMDELPDRVDELAEHKQDPIVVYCHQGVRSEMVARWLRSQGFEQAQTMLGGIDQWSLTIDKALPRY